MSSITAAIDTTYLTQQRDMFTSGLVAQMGANALTVWLAIKSHADFATGEAWCGIRRLAEMTGLSTMTVQRSLKILQEAHLLRVVRKKAQTHVYVARERMDVRIGDRVLVTVAIDYVPSSMRKRLEKLKAALTGQDKLDGQDVFAYVDIIPGAGLSWDQARGVLTGKMRADEIPLLSGPDERLLLNQVAGVLPDGGQDD